MKKIVILHSGGLDSSIMYEIAKRDEPTAEIIPVFFVYGQDYAHKELAAYKKFIDKDNQYIHNIDWLYKSPVGKDGNACGNIMFPGRNMVLSVIAASMYLPNEVWLGALCGEINSGATDKNIEFRNQLTNMLRYVLSPYLNNVKIVYPFVDRKMGKFEATKWAVENGLTDMVLSSSSCLNGKTQKPCGECIVCIRRAGIFKQLNISEEYENGINPLLEKSDYLDAIITAYREKDFSHYDEFRQREIIPALKQIGVLK